MFKTRKELQSQLEASQAEVSRLESELATATALVDESATLSQQVAELTEDLEACRVEMTTETEAHTATKALFEAEQAKTTEEAITKLVTAQLATAGHPPIEDISDETKASTEPLLAQYAKLEGVEKSVFLAAHKEELQAEAKAEENR